MGGKVRMLVVSSDTYPPTRVDVKELFGVKLAARGHEIDWILQSEGSCSRPYVTAWGRGKVWVGATDLGDSLFHRLRKHALGIANDLRLGARMNKSGYDIVAVKDKFIAGLVAALLRRRRGTRFVYWLSYPFPEHYLMRAADGTARYPLLYRIRGHVFAWLLYRLLLRRADHVFVQSEQMRRDLASHGIPYAKMTPVPMGITDDLLAAPPVRAERRVLPRGVPCVLYLGTLVRVRNLDFLIRAFAKLREKVPNAVLYFVGKGDHPSDEEFLKAEIGRLRLGESVQLVGQLPRPRALLYVAEADLCVSPFYPTPVLASASPTKLVEYLALGKAVVANDHPEQRLVILESGAGRCVPWDEQEFADAMQELLADPGMAAEMGVRGRDYVVRHRSYDVIADQVEKKLLELVPA